MLTWNARAHIALGFLLILAVAAAPERAATESVPQDAQMSDRPILAITPERGTCSSQFVARGDQFPPGEYITLVFRIAGAIPDNLPTLAVTTAADGTFAIAIPPALIACLPSQPSGPERQYEVFAQVGARPDLPGNPGTTIATATFTVSPTPAQCYLQTGKCIDGIFLEYWQAHGGLARNGYPLSAVLAERLEDGTQHTVQYFERVRLEYHPQNPPPYDVLLGQFGRRIRPADPPAPPRPGQVYFPETGHNLGGGFLAYWQANGGLMQFGYPISEEFEERLEDGQVYRVQYFERARFEYHPEHAPPYDILLGQFGRRILAEGGP